MHTISTYISPLGSILLAADPLGLMGVWFEGQKYFGFGLSPNPLVQETAVLREAKRWLDIYFSGKAPGFLPRLHLCGTVFRRTVWHMLQGIPYGTTVTYGELAEKLARLRGQQRMSAQAVGNAVGHNPCSILIPCHRVVGMHGKLTGYAGGLEKKRQLLLWEGGGRWSLQSPSQDDTGDFRRDTQPNGKT